MSSRLIGDYPLEEVIWISSSSSFGLRFPQPPVLLVVYVCLLGWFLLGMPFIYLRIASVVLFGSKIILLLSQVTDHRRECATVESIFEIDGSIILVVNLSRYVLVLQRWCWVSGCVSLCNVRNSSSSRVSVNFSSLSPKLPRLVRPPTVLPKENVPAFVANSPICMRGDADSTLASARRNSISITNDAV